MSTEPTRPRALTGLAPRRSLGIDPGLALLRRDSRPAPAPTDEVPPRDPSGSHADHGPDADGRAAPTAPSAAESSSTSVGEAAVAPTERPAGEGHRSDREVDLPRYLQLTRKESRIRADQADRLAVHVRRLNGARKHRDGSVGERITDNTLIRVAIDLLLDHADQLAGTTEEELRRSVSN